nr:ATP-binding cassette domain-containing protein [bacterium]
MPAPLFELCDVSCRYALPDGRALDAVHKVGLAVFPGETLGLSGESGCGKTTLARCLMGLYPVSSGRILYKGRDVTHPGGKDKKQLAAARQMVFQDAASSLNPRLTVRRILTEPFLVQHRCGDRKEIEEKIVCLAGQMGLEKSCLARYPHELSGGQRQRIAIARAMAMEPELLVADEPVSSLDVSIRAQIMQLFAGTRQKGMACLLIAHDLSLLGRACDRIAVMLHGRLVELAPADCLMQHAVHPYTRMLLACNPQPSPDIPLNPPGISRSAFLYENSRWEEVEKGHFVRLPADA